MPEFKDKSKINAYSEDIIPTTAVDDFLDKKTVDRILTYYNDIDKALSEIMRTPVRISELDFYPPSDELDLQFMRYDNVYDEFKPQSWEYKETMSKIDKTVMEELPEIIMSGLEKLGFKHLKFRQMALHNLDSFLPVHCDGNNIKDRNKGRPIPTQRSDWVPEKILNNPQKSVCAFQGMITLHTDDVYGTAVFDQWFPWSVYYMPDFTTATTPRPKKNRMAFLQGDSTERFNEHIRNHTGQKFPEEQFKQMQDLIKRMKVTEAEGHMPLLEQLKIGGFEGLSLETIADFGDPGKLNLWDNKKFHMTMPWIPRYETSRKLIQFETAYKWYE